MISYPHEVRRKKASRDGRNTRDGRMSRDRRTDHRPCSPRAGSGVRRGVPSIAPGSSALDARDARGPPFERRRPNRAGDWTPRLASTLDFGAARAVSDFPTEPSASSSVPFPSARRASKNEPMEERAIEDLPSVQNGGLRNTGLPMKNTSRAEELTRRLHREGLPVARLWETRSALVSLGLSPRGKPGIWLIQKVP